MEAEEWPIQRKVHVAFTIEEAKWLKDFCARAPASEAEAAKALREELFAKLTERLK